MATTSDGRRYMRVPVGTGLFNSPKPQPYSQETKNFLKLIMEESRLTMLQRRTLNEALKNGGSLPAHPPVAHGCQRGPDVSTPERDVSVQYRQRRSKEAIEFSGAYERERFVPTRPIVDKAKMKQLFQDKMAYGKEMPPTPRHKIRRGIVKNEELEIDRFDELVKEVSERMEFLEDMTKLGQRNKYQQLIDQEISSKLREMESLDRQRSNELKKVLKSHSKGYFAPFQDI